jgi:predicted phosphoribosyltransferase
MIVKNHEIKGQDIIIVDDGIATGYTMQAAVKWLQKWNPSSITVAVPVAPNDVTNKLRQEKVTVICVDERDVFKSVGSYYKDFKDMTDQEAVEYHRFAPNGIVRL